MTGVAYLIALTIGVCVGIAVSRYPLWLRLAVAVGAAWLFDVMFPAL
jgi:hypothetical protein